MDIKVFGIMQQRIIDFKEIKAQNITPMMSQYFEIKSQYKEYLLFYRLGDFYELFFDDAISASAILDIALTKRGKGESEMPMCGVPAHSHEAYLQKLISAGCKIAICDQLETPIEAKKRGHKSVVKRDVTRIITPGTVLEENLLAPKENSYLCTIAENLGNYAIAWLDITTGDFKVCSATIGSLFNDITRFRPSEVISSEKLVRDLDLFNLLAEFKRNITIRANSIFDLERSKIRICEHFNILSIEGLGGFTKEHLIAIGAMLEYIEHTQKSFMPRIEKPAIIDSKDFIAIDYSTKKNLEIECSISGDKKMSLLGILDKTKTASGARLLSYYLRTPLTDFTIINQRLDVVECFIKNRSFLMATRSVLSSFPDIERSLARIFINKAQPRHLGHIRDGLEIALLLKEQFHLSIQEAPLLLQQHLNLIGNFSNVFETLKEALVEELPVSIADDNFVRAGFSAHLDELYSFKNNFSNAINSLREKYRALSSILNLKITSNNVLGYFIEITPTQKAKMDESIFIHRQSTGSSIRYTTEELKELEAKINSIDARIAELKLDIFNKLCAKVLEQVEAISVTNQAISFVDVFINFAFIAIERNYIRPQIDNSSKFNIKGGRHPVVEMVLKQNFIDNDCYIDETQTIDLITGPNMAGKSTFMRQNALIAIMAQMGSFVPAKSAHIGVIDKLFSRIGAGDDISRGQSTFMTEMLETANILNNATSRSLLILDEVGRGTATYDGVSIAWAIIEEIHNNIKARTLFSTHYHELTSLESELTQLKCYNMKVLEHNNEIIFLHKIEEGKANKSYGIHVAELAGFPKRVTDRANAILSKIDRKF